MGRIKSFINKHFPIFKVAFGDVSGYFIVLIIVVTLSALVGYYYNEDILLIQIPLTLLGGFIASYGASIVTTIKSKQGELDEKYEGRAYIADSVRIKLYPQNVTFDKNSKIVKFGLRTIEQREGKIVKNNLKVLHDSYHLDVHEGYEELNLQEAFTTTEIKLGTLRAKLDVLEEKLYNIAEISPRWVRMDIKLTKELLQKRGITPEVLSMYSPVSITVERNVSGGYFITLKQSRDTETLEGNLKIGYMVVVPTKKVIFEVYLQEFRRMGINRLSKRRIVFLSNHEDPLPEMRCEEGTDIITIVIERNPRLYVGEQLTVQIPLKINTKHKIN